MISGSSGETRSLAPKCVTYFVTGPYHLRTWNGYRSRQIGSSMQKILRPHLILPVVAFYLYFTGCAPFLGQWDSFDYLKQIVSHQFSALGIGRPVFLGYNILLWESLRKIFHLHPLHLEFVAMAGTILLGVLGVLLFRRLAGRILPGPAANMAALALAVSPVYAIYSGFIMTEVPMLVALLAAALFLWKPGDQPDAVARYRRRDIFRPCRRHPGTGAHPGCRVSVDSFCEKRIQLSRFRSDAAVWFCRSSRDSGSGCRDVPL